VQDNASNGRVGLWVSLERTMHTEMCAIPEEIYTHQQLGHLCLHTQREPKGAYVIIRSRTTPHVSQILREEDINM
jgi:hypothetical protein